ncbi:MAG: ABC transporter ATP-binding protein [Clostridiaceae bacterium]|nr:ABC transporter ATP-binding protein [Clostridiaceae bacterium]
MGIKDAEGCFNAYPHQLSGGMRQRVVIAMAVICKPKLLIADEPTTSLDVITQEQIFNLLLEVHKEYNTSILFITHDLESIKRLCDRMLVMYYGKIIEFGTVYKIFSNPLHEYTKGLIASIPSADRKGRRLTCIDGKLPNLKDRKAGCPFALRCKKAIDICFKEDISTEMYESNHGVSCHLVDVKGVKKYVI